MAAGDSRREEDRIPATGVWKGNRFELGGGKRRRKNKGFSTIFCNARAFM